MLLHSVFFSGQNELNRTCFWFRPASNSALVADLATRAYICSMKRVLQAVLDYAYIPVAAPGKGDTCGDQHCTLFLTYKAFRENTSYRGWIIMGLAFYLRLLARTTPSGALTHSYQIMYLLVDLSPFSCMLIR